METNRKIARLFQLALVGAVPITIHAFSSGPPAPRAGVPGDGGLDCSVCHRSLGAANSDDRGKFTIDALSYTPGAKQKIRVKLEHPEAERWGFQLTARLASDDIKQAGTFTVDDNIRVRCIDGSDAPCRGEREFAEHKRDDARGIDSTQRGKKGSGEFEIEWTAPSSDVGPIVFYAAGNAANNDGANTGDRIYTTRLRVSAACTLTEKPVIRAVVNGASFQPGISYNSMVSIFGSGFAPRGSSRSAGRGDFENERFPNELGCLAVEIGGKRAPITFLKDDQINAQVPTLPVAGPVEVRVIVNAGRPNELRSDPASGVQMLGRAPAFFTFASGRSIAAQHANFDILADPSVIPGGRPAKPGDTVILYGTGFGLTEPVYQAGELARSQTPLKEDLRVTVGNLTLRPEDILYAGLLPSSISGLYQFNIRIPDSTPDGNVPVSVQVSGVRTQEGATIPVKR